MLVRLVPLRDDGVPLRYAFKNMWLRAGKPQKIKFGQAGFKAACIAKIELIDGRVMVASERGDVAVNGEVITGQRPLVQGDVLALRSMTDRYFDPSLPLDAMPISERPLGIEAAYEFQEDLALAKQTRQQGAVPDAKQQGLPGGEIPGTTFTIDETGITQWKRPGKPGRVWRWAELDEIEFRETVLADPNQDWGDDPLRAAMTGLKEGSEAPSYWLLDKTESVAEPEFHAPAYAIRFRSHGKSVGLPGLGFDRTTSEHLAATIERSAPFDLVWFGDIIPEQVQHRFPAAANKTSTRLQPSEPPSIESLQ